MERRLIRFVILGFAICILGAVGYMIAELHRVPASAAQPAAPPPATSPTPAATATTPAKPTLPARAPRSWAPPPSATPPPSPATETPPDATAAARLDEVHLGKTLRQWRHDFGDKMRATQDELHKAQEIVDRPGATPAELDLARGRVKVLTQRMHEDMLELQRIEATPRQ
jgi:hypothetical protein